MFSGNKFSRDVSRNFSPSRQKRSSVIFLLLIALFAAGGSSRLVLGAAAETPPGALSRVFGSLAGLGLVVGEVHGCSLSLANASAGVRMGALI